MLSSDDAAETLRKIFEMAAYPIRLVLLCQQSDRALARFRSLAVPEDVLVLYFCNSPILSDIAHCVSTNNEREFEPSRRRFLIYRSGDDDDDGSSVCLKSVSSLIVTA
jgi:hypothetical protein